jgi:hypothetical protein
MVMKLIKSLIKRLIEGQESIDFEKVGYETMLQCGDDEERARKMCGLRIYSYADALQSELTRFRSEIEQNKNHGSALHAHLYNRPEPVNDAAMLTHAKKVRKYRFLALLTALACLAGNTATFYLFGFGAFMTILLAAGATVLPLVVGHPAYEHIVAKHRKLRVAVILVAVALSLMGVLRLAAARELMMGKTATAAPTATTYVDGAPAETSVDHDQIGSDGTEAKVRETFGSAMLFIMIAADLMLGFFVGLVGHMNTDDDYAAWWELRETTKLVTKLEETVSERHASIEIAKKLCSAGILRAQNVRNNRKPPYHGALAVLVAFLLLGTGMARTQTIDHHEGILIDVSGSVGRNGAPSDLFRAYLTSTRTLLLSEPAKSRVWVSTISVDSFGGVREVVKGWTPESRGVFTDDLNRARHQLASSFEKNSSGMSPAASGTDIFGALWHFKTLFESGPQGTSNTIWIFSDMMNETREFPMPTLLTNGTEKMLEQVKSNGLLVPLKGYKVYVYGATPSGLTPQAWLTIKDFWTLYFQAAGAELVSYSAECDVQRQ